ncbi:MAG: hypothetical protein ACI4F7_04925 [Acutalibacteraceae bacterium]
MIKKIICIVCAVLLFAVTVFAESGGIEITAPEGFYSYESGGSADKAAQILGMTDTELESYCVENGIVFIAVNEDNTKQIRLAVAESSFSASIGNLTNLSEDKITALIPDITGAKRGEIINKDGQSFIKTAETLSDSGGGFTVISYFTVAAKKDYVLSFYTSSGTDTDYAEEVFDGYSSDEFYKAESEKSYVGYIILAAIILLAAGSVYIIFTLVRDIKNDRADADGQEDADSKE